MQGAEWVALFQRIPVARHQNLSLVTTIGIEIAIQDILRLEPEYLVLRGRLAGTTDAGRVFFIPYDQLNYLGFQKPLKEAEIRALYGEGGAEAVEEAEPEPVEVAEGALESASPSPAAEATPESAKPGPARVPMPNKALLLERLRARHKAAEKKDPSDG